MSARAGGGDSAGYPAAVPLDFADNERGRPTHTPARPWLAARRGEEVGMVFLTLTLTPTAPGLGLPDACVELAEACVEPAAGGEGISRVLLATAPAWAYAHGYRHITAAWRSASQAAAGHWPAVGFKPVAYRLSRTLDARTGRA